ncbi:hypothetical protein AVEN_94726-1 [Araneus ventricosus]|uniref:Uncharacterized protein n=1 Tax=Araneus ventricosus TaxID=182803 RepID=A0A4Y2CM38_ARAVE|nr:hypothetical protein AVEN_94726-1 [Araneus ventricosus]
MNSRRFPSPRKPLWKIRFTTQTPSLTLARPKIRLARIEPTKPAGAGVVVRVLKYLMNKTTSFIVKRKSIPDQGTSDIPVPVQNSTDEGAVGSITTPLPDFGLLSMIQNLKGSNCADFFTSLENIGILSRWSKEQMLIIAEIKLEGPARKFYESSLKKNNELNYDTLKKFYVDSLQRRLLFCHRLCQILLCSTI